MQPLLLVTICCKCQNINSNSLIEKGNLQGQDIGAGVGHAQILQDLSRQKYIFSNVLVLHSFVLIPFSDRFFPLVTKMATNNSRITFYQLPTLAKRDSHCLVPTGSNACPWSEYGVSSICTVPSGNEDIHLEREI